MASFKVPCPSCEAPVLIKNPNLVGTKVECPKCKYRFKVEEPAAGGAGAGAAKDAKSDKKADKKADKAKGAGGKNKKLVPIVVGVLALALLGGVGYAVLGGKKGGTKQDPFARNKSKGGGDLPNPDDENKDKKDDKKDDGPKPVLGGSTKVTTNLLPGGAVSVYRLNAEALRNSPAYGAVVDAPTALLCQNTLGFTPDDVETYVHCFAGPDRDPFGVVKLKAPVKAPELLARMSVDPKPKRVNNRDLYSFRGDAFLKAVASALAMRSLLGDAFAAPVAGAAPKDKPYGLCVYDTQHVLIGEYALLEKFLKELDGSGYPPFKTELNGSAPPPKGSAAPAPGDKAFSSVDAYRTVEFSLKRALDEWEADRSVTPLLVYAEQFSAPQYDFKSMKKEYTMLSGALDAVAGRGLRYVSGSVSAFDTQRLTAGVRLTFATPEAARDLAKDKVGPGLALAAEVLKLYLTTPVEVRDYTLPGAGTPGMGTPGMGVPGTGVPMPGQPPRPPRGPGSGDGLEGKGPKGPTDPKGPNDPKEPEPVNSYIDLSTAENQLRIALNLAWPEAAFRTVVSPRLTGVANQIKGKMAVYSAEAGPHVLAAAGPKALAGPQKMLPRGTWDRAKTDPSRLGLEYPPVQRVSFFADLLPYLGRGQLADSINKNAAWYALEYEPVDPKNPDAPRKRALDNLTPAGQWVPELLVPGYPQSAWRATSPYAPDHTFGATNYVGIAGTGLDAARYDPKSTDPETKKKMGMTGYGWGSKAEEVTDGLANTIYLMQTPPGLQQPWIAGGGATVRGFDENNPMGAFTHNYGGKPGTFALMGDGSVRFIPATIDRKVLLALGTRAGGDNDALADVNKVAPLVDPPKPTTTDLKTDPKVTPPMPADKKDPEAKAELAPAPREKK